MVTKSAERNSKELITRAAARQLLIFQGTRYWAFTLKPLGERVVLKQQEAEEKTQSGIILPDSAKEKPQTAVVIAVGPGSEKNGKKTEMQVKVGDRVIYSQYSGTDVKLEDEEYIIVNQSDIIAIVE